MTGKIQNWLQSCKRWKLRNVISFRKSICRYEKVFHIQGLACRGQDKKYQSSLQEIENLLSWIYGRIWKIDGAFTLKVLAIPSDIAAMGDIGRFDDVKKIQKLSGMELVACNYDKHKGQTKISHRGRKRLRYWLFPVAKSAVVHVDEFKQLYEYFTTWVNNPLKKIQSLIMIVCEMLRGFIPSWRQGQLIIFKNCWKTSNTRYQARHQWQKA